MGVLSEWPVLLDTSTRNTILCPIHSCARSEGIAQLAKKHDITFRRDGFLTAFRGERDQKHALYRFRRADGLEPVKPTIKKRIETIDIEIPLEACLIVLLTLSWFWRQARRNRPGFSKGQLR